MVFTGGEKHESRSFFSLIKMLQQHWRARHIHLLPFITPLIPAFPHLHLPFSLFLFGFIGLWSGRTMRPPPSFNLFGSLSFHLLSFQFSPFAFIWCLSSIRLFPCSWSPVWSLFIRQNVPKPANHVPLHLLSSGETTCPVDVSRPPPRVNTHPMSRSRGRLLHYYVMLQNLVL